MQKFITSAVRRLADWVELSEIAAYSHAGHQRLLEPTLNDMANRFERLCVSGNEIWDDAMEEIERRKAQRAISMQFRAARRQKAKELAELDAALTA